jgi:hypothetical protein
MLGKILMLFPFFSVVVSMAVQVEKAKEVVLLPPLEENKEDAALPPPPEEVVMRVLFACVKRYCAIVFLVPVSLF